MVLDIDTLMIRFDLTVSVVKQRIEENYQLSNLTNYVFMKGKIAIQGCFVSGMIIFLDPWMDI